MIVKNLIKAAEIESEDDDPLSSEKMYWSILELFKDLSCLIVFDNCNDPIAFKEFLQDFLEKLPHIKIILTCEHSIQRFDGINICIYKVKELCKKHVLELLKLKAVSQTDHIQELKDLQTTNEKSKNILDHPLFDFLNGHPLSIDILSSLRRNMSLTEIYELLQLIKSYYKTHVDQSTLVLTLSVEASLMFLNNEHKNCQNFLLPLIVCSSGLTKNDLSSLSGNMEISSNLEQLLLSRSLIQSKKIEYHNEMITLYSMETSI